MLFFTVRNRELLKPAHPRRLSLVKASSALLLAVAAFLPVAHGQTVTATVSVGMGPNGIAMNAITNKIYVTNTNDNSVTVIDGATNSTAIVATDARPITTAVNPVTNKIYVANANGDSVTVIDGMTNSTTAVAVGMFPVAIAVNPVTNKIYVANASSNNVTVIDGGTNSTTTVAAGTVPHAIAVNPVTNKIYVANKNSNNVTVIDGGTNSTTTVAAGTAPQAIAVNTVTNKIYVANKNSNNVTVIDGVTNNTATVATGKNLPVALVVNPVTNEVYVADEANYVTIIDGATNLSAVIRAGTSPAALAVNPLTNKIYVANALSNDVTVMDGATNGAGTVTINDTQRAVVVNPATNRIYVTSVGGRVTIMNGADDSVFDSVPTGSTPNALDVNPVTNKIYVANRDSNNVTVIDGSSDATSTVAVGSAPVAVAVNPVTNKVYVANRDSDNITVMDGATNTTTTVDAGAAPIALAVNPVTNNIYVVNATSNTVTVMDGLTNRTATVAVGTFPVAVAVNPVTNKIYVANAISNNVTVIDGATNSTTPVAVGSGPAAVAVNPITNRIYVPSGSAIVVMDGNTNGTSNLPAKLITPNAVAVNVATNKIYIADLNRTTELVLDGATNAMLFVGQGNHAGGLAVNPISGKIYVATAPDLNVITEQKVQPIPLTTTIAPLPGNQFTNPMSPAFNFTTSSTYSPTAPAVQNVYYQFDTMQGPWLAATGTAPNFTGTAPPLLAGIHIVYAFATDGQFADSIQTGNYSGGQSSPIPGAMAAYVFLVLPAPASTAAALTAGINPSLFGQALTFTATVTGSTATPTGTLSFLDGTTLLGTRTLDGAGQARVTTLTPLTAGPHSITAEYSGDTLYAGNLAPALNQVVNPASSTTSLSLTAGSNPSIYGQPVTLTATVDPQFAGTGPPTGVLSFYADGVFIETEALNGSRQATLSALFGGGTHSITAVYAGDSNFLTSTSVLSQTVNRATSTTDLSLTLGADPSTYGQVLTFTATVSPQIIGIPGGQVTFTDGGNAIATTPLSGGQATWTTASLGFGLHRIRAGYTGDANFQGSASVLLQQRVNSTNNFPEISVTFSPAISSDNNNILFRKRVSCTASLSRGDATGTIWFMDGPTLLGSASVKGGGATLDCKQFTIGQHTITAAYGGDATFGSNVTQPVTFYASPRPH